MPAITAAALRGLVALIVFGVAGYTMNRIEGADAGADIGGGFLLVALLALVALVWGAVDGHRRGPGPLTWVLAGVVTALGFVVVALVRHGSDDLTGLAVVTPFVFGLVAGPGAIADLVFSATTHPSPKQV